MKRKAALFVSKFFIVLYKLLYGNCVSFGKNVLVIHKFQLCGRGRLVIGDNCDLWAHEESNKFFFYSDRAKITIGKGSRLNGVTVFCREKVVVGENCLIGSSIISDTDFHEFTDPTHILYGNPKSKPVVIGDGVWLCGECVLLKGSGVGNNSVVGFRAVVTKSFPTDVVIAGNPAKIVKTKYVKS